MDFKRFYIGNINHADTEKQCFVDKHYFIEELNILSMKKSPFLCTDILFIVLNLKSHHTPWDHFECEIQCSWIKVFW